MLIPIPIPEYGIGIGIVTSVIFNLRQVLVGMILIHLT